MASGLAVIAYDYAAAAEHIEHWKNGLLAGFDNPREFASLATNLINAPERIARLGRRARETVERIDWQYVHDDFEAALLEIVETHDRMTSAKDDHPLPLESPAGGAATVDCDS
jgi:glycosyltransferase involved in cell wall biosynthesis